MDEHWTGTVEIAAPPEEVYRYLSDFPRHIEWAQTLERLELLTPGDASGVGATYRTHERQAMQADRKPREPITRGMRAQTVCEVRELVPQRRIAWHAHPKPGMGVYADLAFDIEPLAEGGTCLAQTVHMHQPAVVAWLTSRLMRATPEKAHAQWDASLRNIKTVLEDDAGVATMPSP